VRKPRRTQYSRRRRPVANILEHTCQRGSPDARDAEDILQDVCYELVEANRLLMPAEHVTGWPFRVARNRITDLFRKMAAETGVSVNTPLSRKRYAVLQLRKRRQTLYDELTKA